MGSHLAPFSNIQEVVMRFVLLCLLPISSACLACGRERRSNPSSDGE